MKVFVTGVGGQLGYDVVYRLYSKNVECIGSDILDTWVETIDPHIKNSIKYVKLDITNFDDVDRIISQINPDVVVHCAAWTAVDLAEDPSKKKIAKTINVDGTQNIANVCKKINSKMVYISTDYVFDGKGNKPWDPDCKDYKPLNVYGQTKLDGELAVSSTLDKFFIVRIAWVFGVNGNNFIKTMINLSKNHNSLSVIDDQIGTPTFTYDLAKLLCDMIETDKYGYYHATNSGDYISWYDFACEIFRQINCDIKVNPVSTREYGESIAKRPYNSRLDKSKLTKNGFELLPDWKDAVSRYLHQKKFI